MKLLPPSLSRLAIEGSPGRWNQYIKQGLVPEPPSSPRQIPCLEALFPALAEVVLAQQRVVLIIRVAVAQGVSLRSSIRRLDGDAALYDRTKASSGTKSWWSAARSAAT